MMIIESERLYMRPLEPKDSEALMEVWGDEEVMKYCGGAIDLSVIEKVIAINASNYIKYGNAVFAVVQKTDDRVIGIAGSKIEEGNSRDVELIYHSVKSVWGKSYATEIVSSYLEWLKKSNLADRIYASVMPENNASLRFAQKVGFIQNGYVQFEDTGFIDEPFFEIYFI